MANTSLISRRIYQTNVGTTTPYYRVATVTNLVSAATYVDSTLDDDLGTELETTLHAPIPFQEIHSHISLLWGAEAAIPSTIWYSEDFTHWNHFEITGYESFGSAHDNTKVITTLGEFLTIIQQTQIWNYSTKETPEEKALSYSDRGTQSANAVANLGDALAIADAQGIYLFDTVRATSITDMIKPLFDPDGNFAARIKTGAETTLVLVVNKKVLYLSYMSVNSSENDYTLILDLTHQAIQGLIAKGFTSMTVDPVSNVVYGADSDGYIWQLESGTDDDGAAIAWSFQTKDIGSEIAPMGSLKGGDHIVIDCNPNGNTMTVEAYYDGTLKHTFTVTGSSRTYARHRLLGRPFHRLSFKVSGSGVQYFYGITLEIEQVGWEETPQTVRTIQ